MDNNVTPEVDPQQIAKIQGEANFWKLKYFELLLHTQQVITMLNAPMLQQIRTARMEAMAAAAAGASGDN